MIYLRSRRRHPGWTRRPRAFSVAAPPGALGRKCRQMKYGNTVCLAFSGQRSEAGSSYPGSLRSGLRYPLLARPLPGQHRQFGQVGDNYQRRVRSRGMAAHVHNSDSFSRSSFPTARQRAGAFVHAARFDGPTLVASDKADNLWQMARHQTASSEHGSALLSNQAGCPTTIEAKHQRKEQSHPKILCPPPLRLRINS